MLNSATILLMLVGFAEELRTRRQAIRASWERRLRSETVISPLANPDTLVLMMDRTLDELFATLLQAANGDIAPRTKSKRAQSGCLCGLNPLLAYFRTCASAICTTADCGRVAVTGIDAMAAGQCLDETLIRLREIAQREIAAFCAICQSEISVGKRTCDSLARSP